MAEPSPAVAQQPTDLRGLTFRTLRSSHLEALVQHANNRKIWLNVKDRFPHPYTVHAAEAWIGINQANMGHPVAFAIELDGALVGGAGIELRDDIHRRTGEIGYWVAEPYWGRGIGTAAARFIADYAFAAFPLARLEAGVFSWNPAAARVLEKAGFAQEARLRDAVTKDGRTGDLLLYARLRAGPSRAAAEG
jgi:RimJ/RimL family protein N-acetyltransferase